MSKSDLQGSDLIVNSGAFVTDEVFTGYLSDLPDSGSDSNDEPDSDPTGQSVSGDPIPQNSHPFPVAQIQKQKALESALEDIEKLVCSKKNAYHAQAIQSYLWMVVQNKKRHVNASECAAESQGFSERWGGQMVHCWVKEWVKNRELPSFIQSNKWAVNPEKLIEFSKERMVPTAAEHYLKHITNFEMPQGLKKYMELELFPHIQLKPTHHLLRREGGWIPNGEQPLQKKGVGCGLHQSDVICSTVGWLQDASHTLEYGKNYEGYWTGELFIKQLQEKIIPAFECAHGPGYQMLLMHFKPPLMSRMNMTPGGKQAHMWDGWFMCNGVKVTQQMGMRCFHCELNFIEYFWGATKQYLRNNCDYTFSTLQENMPRALASVEVHTIRKWEHRMKQWMEAYRTRLGAQDAQFWVQEFSSRKYKSHQRVTDMVAWVVEG
ncbi:hypothetical protein BKA83DRAFT_4459587 [Pisolithus microcarpus]|nr:hypothetical protein BKA83DRAFT_4459587 [Pisolithus microcarpus]